ncbi:hypothetical protein [Streptomyces sp. NPDC006784]|uniref:hypothetical protein n=1 Tax=Streptomyces sp. NPDC006784 TaxID=3364764 RepID=UPI0036952C1F
MSAPAADRWHYLTAPFEDLLDEHAVKLSPAPMHGGRLCWTTKAEATLFVFVDETLEALESELVVRGILARLFGVDVAEWPVAMEFTELRA